MLRCLFIVQGEGRGHMTQALALRSMLARAGHRLTGVLLGRSSARAVPAFFRDRIEAPVTEFASPNFVTDPQHRGVRWGATLWQNLRSLRAFRRSLAVIDAALRRQQPDVVLTFFEPLAGIYHALYRPRVPFVAIGHQYLFLHPVYPFPPDRPLQRGLARGFTALTALGAARRLALSFYPADDRPERGLVVVPPLLRDELLRQPLDREEPFILAYVLNHGLGEEVRRWHADHPEVVLHAFWDNPSAPDPWRPHPNLTFHHLHDTRFLEMMARCRGLVCTAGFESVCEAMYLGKPVLMVPVEGHFEQYCNARDAAAVGAGLYDDHFAIDRLLAYLPHHAPRTEAFRAWVAEAEARFLREIETVVDERRPAVVGV